MPQGDYKRKIPRIRVDFPVLLKSARLARPVEAAFSYGFRAKDISSEGMRLETRLPLSRGDLLELEFSLSKGTRKLSLFAEVVSTPAKGTVGLRFSSISEKDRTYLRSILGLYGTGKI